MRSPEQAKTFADRAKLRADFLPNKTALEEAVIGITYRVEPPPVLAPYGNFDAEVGLCVSQVDYPISGLVTKPVPNVLSVIFCCDRYNGHCRSVAAALDVAMKLLFGKKAFADLWYDREDIFGAATPFRLFCSTGCLVSCIDSDDPEACFGGHCTFDTGTVAEYKEVYAILSCFVPKGSLNRPDLWGLGVLPPVTFTNTGKEGKRVTRKSP